MARMALERVILWMPFPLLANFSSVYEVDAAYRFFRDDVVIYSESLQDNWMNTFISSRMGNRRKFLNGMAKSLQPEEATKANSITVKMCSSLTV